MLSVIVAFSLSFDKIKGWTKKKNRADTSSDSALHASYRFFASIFRRVAISGSANNLRSTS